MSGDGDGAGRGADAYPRVQRLDPHAVVEALFEQTGVRLTVEGRPAGGQVGTAFVRDADGVLRVLKMRRGVTVREMRRGPLAVLDALRAVGYPAPGTVMACQVGDGVVFVHELLPGEPLRLFGPAQLERALELNAMQAGVLRDRPDVACSRLFLREDGPGFCLHEPLRRYSARAAALEARVLRIGEQVPETLPGDDALHHDFHPGNMLGPSAGAANGSPAGGDEGVSSVGAITGAITGVVDWDGAGRGHRGFDLVTLRFGLHADDAPSVGDGGSRGGVVAALDAAIDALPASVRAAAWAHMSLRMCDWAVRHFSAARVESWLAFAEAGLARLE